MQPPPPPIEMEGALEYEVESILEHQFWGIKNPEAYYKVAWKGYGIEHNSWKPESNIVNAPEVLADYGNGKLKSRQGLERFCMLSKLSERSGAPVLPTTPVSRLAHVGCSSQWLRNVVYPIVWFGMKYSLVVSHVMCSVCIISPVGRNQDRGRR
jgi:hypothetical protein